MQSLIPHLHTAHIEHHVYNITHLAGLLEYPGQLQFQLIISKLTSQKPLQWSINQRQRSTQLMADINQETHLILIHLTLPLLHLELQPVFLLPYNISHYQITCQRNHQYQDNNKPRLLPPWRYHLQRQNTVGTAPTSILSTARRHYPVLSHRQRMQCQRMVIRLYIRPGEPLDTEPEHLLPEHILFPHHRLYHQRSMIPRNTESPVRIINILHCRDTVENNIRQFDRQR